MEVDEMDNNSLANIMKEYEGLANFVFMAFAIIIMVYSNILIRRLPAQMKKFIEEGLSTHESDAPIDQLYIPTFLSFLSIMAGYMLPGSVGLVATGAGFVASCSLVAFYFYEKMAISVHTLATLAFCIASIFWLAS